MINVVTDKNKKFLILDWVAQRANFNSEEVSDFDYIAFEENNKIIGAVIFNDYDGNNLFVHMALDNPKVYQRKFIRLTFDYIFNKKNCGRVTGQCFEENKKIHKLLTSVGFKKEGVVRNIIPTDNGYKDAAIFGMLKEECKWV
jgi:RimJ/RimL family protein N-acetyltransferase